MIGVRQAQQIVLSELPRLPVEHVGLDLAGGRALAAGITSDRDIPPFRNSAMDGYALRSSDLTSPQPTVFEVIETIAAGTVPARRIEPGTAAMIMTGAIVPDGADAVVRVEDTERDGAKVTVLRPVQPGANVRLAGEDIRRGNAVLAAGHSLRPADVGVLASLGVTRVPVARRPTVAILTTGDELVEPDQTVAPGQIVNSNAYTLAAAVQQAGGIPHVLGIVRDVREQTRAAFETAFTYDLVLSTGGVSMGVFDLVREVLASLGVIERFWKVAQKPGKPISFGMRGATPVFGLPGNPVSSLVCFHLYVQPALRAMQGLRELHLPAVRATSTTELRTAAGMTEFVRCLLTGPLDDLRVQPTGTQSSAALRSMSLGDGLLVSPPEQSHIAAGERVTVLLLEQRFTAEAAV
ncbi:MAG TPA: gephyrin-like molybdotransferase Glp [Terriglobales bacterium]|nr:gephyrin-like molybdotransferase Glp [Terriglobales bacterium]